METIEGFTNSFMPFFSSAAFDDLLFYLKILFIVFGVFAIGFIIFALFKSSWLRVYVLYDAAEFFRYKPFGIKRMEKDWRKILARLDTGLESEYKLTVIEADNTMNDILKKMGYGGASLEESLEKLTVATLSNIEELKEAHQIRNNIVRDPDYKLTLDETKKALGIYEKALRDLDAF
ncbi:MAG: hypothetical protein A2Z68_01625 [Candidatus Nealsonbacteria bacterium RBG_13_38_11]|uniref:DUF4129 domain-containing protein n=1 Tax=Candidatus Nealsonbacteria bacterium RBG_13_38_11 TaxID=1801662 RepID=A0A1G2E2D2_9BACT|nr:MAG: hypothetical protein A2Z68_01625 [Candidatus Nealsonbacteria bacterium RBG_13_38_11]HXK32374.1 hypothetical protein [Candidatus Paceibacterota bacterium]